MKLRTAVAGAVGVVGGAVVGNRLLKRRAGDLENPLPGVERSYRWRGMDVAYTVAGEPSDPDLVLFHGLHAGASSYEFEPVFEVLADSYHVFAVDLPGFGRSDRPPLHYSPTLYREFLGDFLADATEDPIVVASSLTGAHAAAVAAEGDAPLERLVLVCPTDDTGTQRPWLRTALRAPLVGTAAFNLLASKPSIRYFLDRDGYYDADSIDPEEVDYTWRSAHQPGARHAPAAFTAGELDPETDLRTTLEDCEVPVTLVWGRDAELVPLREGRDLAEATDLDLIVIDYATQLPHAEHPREFVEYLEAELLEVDRD